MALYERKKDTWSIIVPLPKGPDGKYRQKTVTFYGTKKAAKAREAELIAERNRGEFVEPTRTTLSEWLDTWLEKSVKPPLCTINTYRTYRAALKQHLKPRLGSMLLQRITPLDIDRYYAESKLKPRTLRLHRAILTTALNAAVDANMLRNNPAQKARRLPKLSRSERKKVWTVEEAKRFLSTVGQESAQVAALFALALDTGCRKAELLGLRWTDWDGSVLRVERQLIRMDADEADEPTFGVTKGKEPRQIQLSQQTLDLLKTHKSKQAELKLKNRLHYADYSLMFAQEWEHQNGPTCKLGKPDCREHQ